MNLKLLRYLDIFFDIYWPVVYYFRIRNFKSSATGGNRSVVVPTPGSGTATIITREIGKVERKKKKQIRMKCLLSSDWFSSWDS